jgi:hypothetical protein
LRDRNFVKMPGHCPGVISKHTAFGFLIRACIYKL